MMEAFIFYNVEVFFCLAIFYCLYYIGLRRETNHSFVRAYLLGSVFLSFLLPFSTVELFTAKLNELMPAVTLPDFVAGAASAESQVAEVSGGFAFSWIYPYVAVMVVFTVFFFIELRKILSIRKSKRQSTADFQGYPVVIHQTRYPTFSFMNTIYLAEEDVNPETSRERILLHEASHIRGAHSIDIILMELLRIVFWINPMIYLYKNALTLSHEYIADQDSVAADDQQKYVNLLVNQTLSNLGLSLGSHFGRKSGILPQWPWANGLYINKSQTLKRIKMIKNKSKMNKLKYLIPVVAIVLSTIVVSCVQDENATEISDKLNDPKTEVEKAEINSTYNEVFEQVENPPIYNGGNTALYKYLGMNINYPKQARTQGVQGRVFVEFLITKDGKVADAKVLKGIGAGCDEEALRVINEMMDWTPGTQQGKAVNVRMVLPIFFKLPETGGSIPGSELKSSHAVVKEEVVVSGYQN